MTINFDLLYRSGNNHNIIIQYHCKHIYLFSKITEHAVPTVMINPKQASLVTLLILKLIYCLHRKPRRCIVSDHVRESLVSLGQSPQD